MRWSGPSAPVSPTQTLSAVTPSRVRSTQVVTVEPSSSTVSDPAVSVARTPEPRTITLVGPSPVPIRTKAGSTLNPGARTWSSVVAKSAPPSTSSQSWAARCFSLSGSSRVVAAPKIATHSPGR